MNIMRNIVANHDTLLVMTNLYGIPVRIYLRRAGDLKLMSYDFLPPSPPQRLKIQSGMYGDRAKKNFGYLLSHLGEERSVFTDTFFTSVSFADEIGSDGDVASLVFPKAEKPYFRDFVVSIMSGSPKVLLKSKWNALDDGSEKRPASAMLSGHERKSAFLYFDDTESMPDHPHLVLGTRTLWRGISDMLGMSSMTEAQAEYFKKVVGR